MNDNDKISLWIGMVCTCERCLPGYSTIAGDNVYWGRCAMHGQGGMPIPWQTSERKAVELLPVLMERGYSYCLKSYPDNLIFFQIYDLEENAVTKYIVQPDIPQAICAAILQLIEMEK